MAKSGAEKREPIKERKFAAFKYEDYRPQMEDKRSPKRSRKNETIRANNKRAISANKQLDAGKYAKADMKRVPSGKAGDKIWRSKKAVSK